MGKNIGQEKNLYSFFLKTLTTRSICLPFILTLCILSLFVSLIQFSRDNVNVNTQRLNRELSWSKSSILTYTSKIKVDTNKKVSNHYKYVSHEPVLVIPHNSHIKEQATKLKINRKPAQNTSFSKVKSNKTQSNITNVLHNDMHLDEKLSPATKKAFKGNSQSADYFENKWETSLHDAEIKGDGESVELDIFRGKLLKSASRYTSWYKKNPRFSEYYSPNITLLPPQTKGVILLTNYRSGSTFLGELFNQHPDSFYTFEPLIFFTGGCNSQTKLKVSLLENLLKCEFPEMSDVFKKIQSPMRKSSVDIECLTNNFCFRKKNKDLCQKDLCPHGRYPKCYKCGPIHLPRVSNKCREKKMSVLKVIRLCDILKLKPILTNPDLDIKVIHLVRDPRGIESSRLKIDHKKSITNDVKSTCDRLLHNALIGSSNSSELKWLEKRYIRIRYEDMSLEPLENAAKIYKFVGLPFLPEVRQWILSNTQASTNSKRNPYTTKRNSAYTMQAWRKHLNITQVREVQRQCGKTMQYLGYKVVKSENELVNFDIKLLNR